MLLNAPFPYRGGKRRIADDVWQKFGMLDIYSEPFCGSAAILLSNPKPADREIVNDSNGHICNFWRSVQKDPSAVARYANWPSFHHDLTARHRWLIEWEKTSSEKLESDPNYYDAQAAGWWVWGMSLSIRGDWCSSENFYADIPCVTNVPGGRGVSMQRKEYSIYDNIEDRLVDVFKNLSVRLANVITLNRDWTAAVTTTMLAQVKSSPKNLKVGVFLDPPYLTEDKSTGFYQSENDNVAVASYKWAIENQDKFKIAYCCADTDFPVPEGWTYLDKTFKNTRTDIKDRVMFSPLCANKQGTLI